MDIDYKTSKESFTLNPNASSSPLEILSLSLLNQWSFFLLTVILSVFPVVYESSSVDRLIIESIVLYAPVILGLTICSSFPVIFPSLLLIAAVSLLITYRRLITSCQWTEVLLIPKKIRPTRVQAVDGIYRSLLVTTVVSILAVDFNSFPRSFCKTSTFGFSIMDMGVGSFIMINGMISPEARTAHYNDKYLIRKSIAGCIPLIGLGVQRLLLVKSINYHEIVTEYGVHWNFFFTLAFVKMISTISHKKISKFIDPAAAGFVVLIAHQILLSSYLKDMILSSDRSNFILANKEGIFTLPGYVALYLVSVSLGSRMYGKRRSGKVIDYVAILIETGAGFVVSAILCAFCHLFVDEVSRRQANMTFVLWMISFSCFLMMAESLLQLVIEFMQATGFLRFQSNSKPILSSLMCENSLFVFLLANVMTGIVNLSIDTMTASYFVTLIILVLYTSLLSIATYVLSDKKIKFKIPDSLVSKCLDKIRR